MLYGAAGKRAYAVCDPRKRLEGGGEGMHMTGDPPGLSQTIYVP